MYFGAQMYWAKIMGPYYIQRVLVGVLGAYVELEGCWWGPRLITGR